MINLRHKIILVKWTIQNYLLKIQGKKPIHCPTKPYINQLKQLNLDGFIRMVIKSYNC